MTVITLYRDLGENDFCLEPVPAGAGRNGRDEGPRGRRGRPRQRAQATKVRAFGTVLKLRATPSAPTTTMSSIRTPVSPGR